MKFEELSLYDAIMTVREEMEAAGESPGADKWITDEDLRIAITQRVMRHLLKDADQAIINAWCTFRKGVNLAPDLKKVELIVCVARIHGARCFYANRGRGPCSEDVHIDRLIPGSRGGQYTLQNCVLACGTHNTMRQDKPLEEFLAGG